MDISEEPIGNPTTASLPRRRSFGVLWEERVDTHTGLPVLITTTTLDDGSVDQQGFCIYPRACVLEMKVVKRARKKRARKQDAGGA